MLASEQRPLYTAPGPAPPGPAPPRPALTWAQADQSQQRVLQAVVAAAVSLHALRDVAEEAGQ